MRLHLGGRRRRPGGEPAAPTRTSRVVLLVVDDGGGAGAMRRVAGQLDGSDWSVQVVTSTAEAATAGGRVDGVLLSLDGVDDAAATCTAVRAGDDRVILVVTSSPTSQDCIRVLDAGADEYVPAYIPGDELRLRLRNLLRHRIEADDTPRVGIASQPSATAR